MHCFSMLLFLMRDQHYSCDNINTIIFLTLYFFYEYFIISQLIFNVIVSQHKY